MGYLANIDRDHYSMKVIAKVNNKIVEIIHTARRVEFSPEEGWVLVNFDVDKPPRRVVNVKWMPATTKFDWVRPFTML